MRIRTLLFVLSAVILLTGLAEPYPIDAYEQTGIRRLERQRLIAAGQLGGNRLPPGATKKWSEITLHHKGNAAPMALPAPDAALEKQLAPLFTRRNPNYAFALLDLTPGRAPRLATHKWGDRYVPGSVGKLAIAAGLFAELQRRFPDDTDARRRLLKERFVTAGYWVRSNSHTVPIFDVQTHAYKSRAVLETDVFNLYEWADHMTSASSNAAASVVWKEVILMRAFGDAYPPTPEEETAFFKETPKTELRTMALSVVNDPLRAAGIAQEDWQLGTLFTAAGQNTIPGAPSHANPRGLLTFLLRIEEGRIVDPWSSLEIKRLMYSTERRIRYASAPVLADDAVYFKSGSLYKCKEEEGFTCGKYMGNVDNYMNSVAIVETADGRVYAVALMSNVLRKNSASDHQALATEVEAILAEH